MPTILDLTEDSTLDDIESVIRTHQAILAVTSPGDPGRAILLDQEGMAWFFKGRRTKSKYHYAEGLRRTRQALDEATNNHPQRASILNHLSQWMAIESRLTNQEHFLTEALSLVLEARTCVEPTKTAMKDLWSEIRINISLIMLDLIGRFPRIGHCTTAIEFHRSVVASEDVSRWMVVVYLGRLVKFLTMRYRLSKNMADVDEATARSQDMRRVLEESRDDGDSAGAFQAVAQDAILAASGSLVGIYQESGLGSLLVEAEQVCRRALEADAQMSANNRARLLCNLGVILEARFQRFKETDPGDGEKNLDEAIKVGLDALQVLFPDAESAGEDDGPAWESAGDNDFVSHLLNMLAIWMGEMMKLTKQLDWGNPALRLLHDALHLRPPHHPEQPRIAGHIGHLLDIQCEILQEQGQPEEARARLSDGIDWCQRAVSMTRPEDIELGTRRKNLAIMLVRKARLEHSIVGSRPFNLARDMFMAAARTSTATVVVRLQSAMQAGLLFHAADDARTAHDLFQEGLDHVLNLNPREVTPRDLQQTLRQSAGLASFAASVALEASEPAFTALRSLETGRCVLSGHTQSVRSETARLRVRHPVAASEYEDLHKRLEPVNAGLATGVGEWGDGVKARAERRIILAALKDKEDEIRKSLPGFADFLLPLDEAGARAAACDGPVIAVNVSRIRSDAILITSDRIRVLPLPDLEHEHLEKKLDALEKLGNSSRRDATIFGAEDDSPTTLEDQELLEVLAWTWRVAVRPILDALGLLIPKGSGRGCEDLPRVWWLPSGTASRVPFHTAGDHTAGSLENTFSHVVSSYTSSIKALRYARQIAAQSASPAQAQAPSNTPRMLLVTMPNNPPPHRNLDTSHEEAAAKTLFSGDDAQPGSTSLTILTQPTPEAVLSALPGHPIVHCACHASSVAYDPTKSGLLLQGSDGEAAMLTVADLEGRIAMATTDGIGTPGGGGGYAALAYLSACSTAELADGRLADEAIHLANGFQTLGFAHVIGAMWGADDEAAGLVARRFYETLLTARGGRSGTDNGADVEKVSQSTEKSVGRFMSFEVGRAARALHGAMTTYRDEMGGRTKGVGAWAPFIHIGP